MDENSTLAIEWLQALPPHTVVSWSEDTVDGGRPWTTHWLDVRVIEPPGPDCMNWVWTVLSPDDPDQGTPEQLWQFPVAHDLEVHEIYGPPPDDRASEFPVPLDLSPPPALLAALPAAAARIGTVHRVRGGWSVRRVSDALHDWSRRHADRGDVRFRCDLTAPRSQIVQEIARTLGGSGEESGESGTRGFAAVYAQLDTLLRLDPADATAARAWLWRAHAVMLDDPGARDGRATPAIP